MHCELNCLPPSVELRHDGGKLHVMDGQSIVQHYPIANGTLVNSSGFDLAHMRIVFVRENLFFAAFHFDQQQIFLNF